MREPSWQLARERDFRHIYETVDNPLIRGELLIKYLSTIDRLVHFWVAYHLSSAPQCIATSIRPAFMHLNRISTYIYSYLYTSSGGTGERTTSNLLSQFCDFLTMLLVVMMIDIDIDIDMKRRRTTRPEIGQSIRKRIAGLAWRGVAWPPCDWLLSNRVTVTGHAAAGRKVGSEFYFTFVLYKDRNVSSASVATFQQKEQKQKWNVFARKKNDLISYQRCRRS